MYMMIRSLLIPCKSDVTIFDLKIGEVFQIKHYIANIKNPNRNCFVTESLFLMAFSKKLVFIAGFISNVNLWESSGRYDNYM